MKRFFDNKILHILSALFVCLLWGSLFPFVKIGYAAFSIDTNDIPSIILFAGIRFTTCGLILTGLQAARHKKGVPLRKKTLGLILLSGFFSIILHYAFTYIALSLGEGSKSAIIKQVGFLFVSLFAFIFDKQDSFSVRKLLAGILGFAGIIVTNLDGNGFSFGMTDVLLLLASFCSVVSFAISKEVVKTVSPVRSVAVSQLFGGLVLLLYGLVSGGRINTPNFGAILVFLYICLSSVLAYTLWNLLLRYMDLSRLSVIKFAEPLFAVILSGLFLSENILKITYGIALVMILAAILISNTGGKKHASTHS